MLQFVRAPPPAPILSTDDQARLSFHRINSDGHFHCSLSYPNFDSPSRFICYLSRRRRPTGNTDLLQVDIHGSVPLDDAERDELISAVCSNFSQCLLFSPTTSPLLLTLHFFLICRRRSSRLSPQSLKWALLSDLVNCTNFVLAADGIPMKDMVTSTFLSSESLLLFLSLAHSSGTIVHLRRSSLVSGDDCGSDEESGLRGTEGELVQRAIHHCRQVCEVERTILRQMLGEEDNDSKMVVDDEEQQ